MMVFLEIMRLRDMQIRLKALRFKSASKSTPIDLVHMRNGLQFL